MLRVVKPHRGYSLNPTQRSQAIPLAQENIVQQKDAPGLK